MLPVPLAVEATEPPVKSDVLPASAPTAVAEMVRTEPVHVSKLVELAAQRRRDEYESSRVQIESAFALAQVRAFNEAPNAPFTIDFDVQFEPEIRALGQRLGYDVKINGGQFTFKKSPPPPPIERRRPVNYDDGFCCCSANCQDDCRHCNYNAKCCKSVWCGDPYGGTWGVFECMCIPCTVAHECCCDS